MKPLRFLFLLGFVGLTTLTAAPPVPTLPPPGTAYRFFGLRYLGGHIQFRDVTPNVEQLYPNYWLEVKPGEVRGEFVFDPQQPKLAMSLTCRMLAQPDDGMDLKILGEVMTPGKMPPVRFTATKIGPWQPATADRKACEVADVTGELDVNGRLVKVTGQARLRYSFPQNWTPTPAGNAAPSLNGLTCELSVNFSLKGSDLGLKKVADRRIGVTVISRAYTAETILAGTGKKTLIEAGVKDLQ